MTTQDSSVALAPSDEDIILGLPGYDPRDQAGESWFDGEAASIAVEFIESCIRHVKGGKAGQLFILTSWEKSLVGNLFGWKRPDGTRRYREAFVYVGKKNGKTALIAAILLTVMATDPEYGAELYSAAASKEQAGLIFQHAMGMVKQEPELHKRFTIYGAKGGSQQKSIVYENMGGAYKCLSADANTADGVNPSFIAIDELHRHADGELAEVLQKSTGARTQPITIYTTTADFNRPSLCNTMLKRARQVRDNKGDPSRVGYDPAFLPVVYEADREDDWTSPATWAKANPNLDVTITTEFLARECKKAQETPSELNNFLRLHLNIVTDAVETWISANRWTRTSGLQIDESPVDWRKRMLSQLKGEPCFLGLDLSSKIDATAAVQVFRPSGDRKQWVIIPTFWVPNETATEKEKVDHVPYKTWERMGFVRLTEGNEVDSQAIRAFINQVNVETPIQLIGYDDWNATELSRQLREDDGFGDRMVPVRQGTRSLSDPMKEFEAMVVGARLIHGSNPTMDWMVGNLSVKRDENGNLQPHKSRSTGKIDGPVATFNALRCALDAPSANAGRSIYATRGIDYI